MGNAKTIHAIGDESARAASAIKKSINPVSVLYFGIVPGLIGSCIMFGFLLFIGVSISGTMPVRTCDESTPKKCETTQVSRGWNILWYLIFVPFVGFIVGGMVYKLVFMVKNPRIAAGLFITDTAMGIFRK